MRPETAIQIQIVETLSILAGEHGFFFFSVPNEGFMESVAMKTQGFTSGGAVTRRMFSALMTTLKKMGLTPGVPDLVVTKEGRAYFLEVKTDIGRASKVQEIVHKRLAYCGCKVAVVRSLVDAVETLKEWGVVG